MCSICSCNTEYCNTNNQDEYSVLFKEFGVLAYEIMASIYLQDLEEAEERRYGEWSSIQGRSDDDEDTTIDLGPNEPDLYGIENFEREYVLI